MAPALTAPNVISPYREALSYEYLYAQDKMSRKRISELLPAKNARPSDAFMSYLGLIGPDQAMLERIERLFNTKKGFSVQVNGMPQFPRRIMDASNALPVFYYRGNIDLLSAPSVSVVGTREASEAGKQTAKAIVSLLVERKYAIVSGLAKGIDTAAIQKCLELKGSVIGVIATPIDRCYPAKNSHLQEHVAQEGLLISQVPFYRYENEPFDAHKRFFPERNITMASISEATVIVETGQTSGTRTQAQACMKQHRKLIIMEDVIRNASWTQPFIARGAYCAKSPDDAVAYIQR